MKEYVPTYVGTVTKYVFVESPDITPQTLAVRAYEVSGGAMIKETCFGLQVTGTPDEVKRIVTYLRSLDPSHIFTKDRGFPPGDTRRCRANLGGARPGYYGHEFEMGLLRYIARGIEAAEAGVAAPAPRASAEKLSVDRLKKIIESEER
jgi:putative methanogenesis marker protein 6